MSTECPHFFSDPQWCEECTPRASKEEPKSETGRFPNSFQANYRGRCSAKCGDPIEEGDWIVRDEHSTFGPSVFMHDECG